MEDFAKYFQNKVQAKRTKQESFIQYWRALANVPMMVEPIHKDHVGTTRSEDAIRVTGSPRFIAAVCSRLKDVLLFDSPSSRVEVTYRQATTPKSSGLASYNLYVKFYDR